MRLVQSLHRGFAETLVVEEHFAGNEIAGKVFVGDVVGGYSA